jgi:hypothetical protein
LVFRTVPGGEFPYEFLGWAPLVGDVVERGGSFTAYMPSPPLELEGELHLVALCVHLNTGAESLVSCADDGRVSGRVWWRANDPEDRRLGVRRAFEAGGETWLWTQETIRDVDDAGEYSWAAPVCVRAGDEAEGPLWTPAFRALSEQRHRTSASTASHARRLRERGSAARAERIDPRVVFDRDGWVCQLCGQPIDADCAYPDPACASIDHRVPLAAGGEHTLSNVWTAHLQCNLRKGARRLPE